MVKQKVILSKPFLPAAVEILRRNHELVIAADLDQDLARTAAEHGDAVALISFLSDPVDRTLIDALPALRIIANYAVGYNNIDFAHARQKGIYVTNTPDILTEATADLTLALVLAACRRIVEADHFVRSGRFHGWEANLMLGKELNVAVMGIIGMGRIGLAVARRAQAFGMKILYCSRQRKPEAERKYHMEHCGFIDLLRQADVVSLHLPYSPDVKHLFNADTFALMKPDAVFINAARGALMDEQALVRQLEQNKLFAAGLDVYEFEPAVSEKLKSLNNVVLAPHIGSATHETRMGMAMMTIRAVEQALAGERPTHLIAEWG